MNAAVPLHRERESFRLPFPFLPAPGRADPGATSAPACERLPLITGAASGFGALCLVFFFKHRIPVHVRVCAGSAPEGEGDRKLLARWHRRRIQELGGGGDASNDLLPERNLAVFFR